MLNLRNQMLVYVKFISCNVISDLGNLHDIFVNKLSGVCQNICGVALSFTTNYSHGIIKRYERVGISLHRQL